MYVAGSTCFSTKSDFVMINPDSSGLVNPGFVGLVNPRIFDLGHKWEFQSVGQFIRRVVRSSANQQKPDRHQP